MTCRGSVSSYHVLDCAAAAVARNGTDGARYRQASGVACGIQEDAVRAAVRGDTLEIQTRSADSRVYDTEGNAGGRNEYVWRVRSITGRVLDRVVGVAGGANVNRVASRGSNTYVLNSKQTAARARSKSGRL